MWTPHCGVPGDYECYATKLTLVAKTYTKSPNSFFQKMYILFNNKNYYFFILINFLSTFLKYRNCVKSVPHSIIRNFILPQIAVKVPVRA